MAGEVTQIIRAGLKDYDQDTEEATLFALVKVTKGLLTQYITVELPNTTFPVLEANITDLHDQAVVLAAYPA